MGLGRQAFIELTLDFTDWLFLVDFVDWLSSLDSDDFASLARDSIWPFHMLALFLHSTQPLVVFCQSCLLKREVSSTKGALLPVLDYSIQRYLLQRQPSHQAKYI
jgi:hypothetical protein